MKRERTTKARKLNRMTTTELIKTLNKQASHPFATHTLNIQAELTSRGVKCA